MNRLAPIPLPVTGTLSSSPVIITPTSLAIGASSSGNIPSGSIGFVFISLTGTVTLGGQTIPAGTTISTDNKLATNLAYTTGAASSAFLYYQT